MRRSPDLRASLTPRADNSRSLEAIHGAPSCRVLEVRIDQIVRSTLFSSNIVLFGLIAVIFDLCIASHRTASCHLCVFFLTLRLQNNEFNEADFVFVSICLYAHLPTLLSCYLFIVCIILPRTKKSNLMPLTTSGDSASP